MSITRAPRPESNFYILDKRISEDRRLSWAASGLLIYLLGKPDHWRVSVAALVKEKSASAKPTKRDSVYSLLRELEAAGYLSRSQDRGDSGRFGEQEYIVSEIPSQPIESPHTDLPDTDLPHTVKQTLVSTDLKQGLKDTPPQTRAREQVDHLEQDPNPKALEIPAWLRRDADRCERNAAARAEPAFVLSADWKPGPEFADRCAMFGLPGTYTASQLGEFISYWSAEASIARQGQWEHRFLSRLKRDSLESTTGARHATSRSDQHRETPLERGLRHHQNMVDRINNGTAREWLASADDTIGGFFDTGWPDRPRSADAQDDRVVCVTPRALPTQDP